MIRPESQTYTDMILEELKRALDGPVKLALQTFANTLRRNFDHYDWVGIYLVKGEKLVLGAYSGHAETEHTQIPIGEGICGYAAKAGKTVVVSDVAKDPRYLMCFSSTRSEIVVPIKGKKGVIGEIDIDSDRLAAFSREDETFLEIASGHLAEFLENRLTQD